MQGDENRIRYWFVLPQQQRDEFNPDICRLCLNDEDISYALHTEVKGVEVRWPRWQILGTPLPLQRRVEYSLR
jgi:outer membrane phospholipase A